MCATKLQEVRWWSVASQNTAPGAGSSRVNRLWLLSTSCHVWHWPSPWHPMGIPWSQRISRWGHHLFRQLLPCLHINDVTWDVWQRGISRISNEAIHQGGSWKCHFQWHFKKNHSSNDSASKSKPTGIACRQVACIMPNLPHVRHSSHELQTCTGARNWLSDWHERWQSGSCEWKSSSLDSLDWGSIPKWSQVSMAQIVSTCFYP